MKQGRLLAALLGSALLAAPALAADGKAVYDSVCYKCHRAGTDDAPRTGNKADWAPRISKSIDELVKSVIEGKGAMEPRGNRPELTDEEIKAAVNYLVGLVK